MEQMNIPKTIRIGYQKRGGTYTGQLAYVTWIDSKGKHRKEASWTSWRDHKISPNDYPNEPLSGFVLNRKAGGGSSGWNHRNTYCRVYDPRGFEFEIDIPNLLFILQECDCIKGKGLEGEFVYAWDGSDLVLLPVTSQEYKKSSEYTKLQSQKVTKKDMVDGCIYLTKKEEKVMYLGRHAVHQYQYESYSWTNTEIKKSIKAHVFARLDAKEPWDRYQFEKGFTKLAKKLTPEPDPTYVDVFDVFNTSKYMYKGVTPRLKKTESYLLYNRGRHIYLYKHTDGSMHFVKQRDRYHNWQYAGQEYVYISHIKFKDDYFETVCRTAPLWFDGGTFSELIKGNSYKIEMLNEHGVSCGTLNVNDKEF